MDYQKDIIVIDKLGVVPTDSEVEYLAHLLCLGGTCRYRFNERDFELHAGDLSIIRKRKLIEKTEPSDDFRCKIIYAKPGFIDLCTPQSNYGMKGSLALFLNPVMHLTPEQQIVCRRDFDLLEQRIADTEHRFYRETLVNAMQAAILDFFDFHARIYGESDISTQNASIMNRFLNAGSGHLPRTSGGVLLRRLSVRLAEIPLGGLQKGQRIRRQLLDQPLYDPRHHTSAPRQIADIRADFRYVRLLVSGLFQPLRAAEFRAQSDGLPEVIRFPGVA